MHFLNKLMVPIVCFFGVVSCGTDNNSTEQIIQENTKNTLKENPQKSTNNKYISPLPDTAPTLTVAIEKDDYPPFEYKNEYGKYIGYDLDLIRSVGEEAGFKVKINFVPFSDVLPSLNSGANDIAISALTASAERISNFDSSLPYIKSSSTFIVKADSKYQNAAQVVDQRIAVQEGGFQAKELKLSNYNHNLVNVKTNFLGFQSILTGKSDALYADKTMLMYLANQFPEHKVNYIPYGEETTLAIFAKKGNNQVMVKVNEGLASIKSNGRYQALNNKWFGSNADEIAIK